MNTSTTPPENLPPVAEEPATGPSAWTPPKLSRRGTALAVALALLGIGVVLYAWRLPPFSSALQNTDNAYVRGQTTVISPQLSGYITAVAVTDFQAVKEGELLAQIDDRIYRQRVEQAQAALDGQLANLNNSAQSREARAATRGAQQAALGNAQVQLDRVRKDKRRADDLIKKGWISQRDYDQATASLHQAEAAVAQARAAVDVAAQDVKSVEVNRGNLQAAVDSARAALHLAEIDLANTRITAPRSGRLSEIGVRVGQYVSAGSQLMFLVPARLWVIANYKEAQTANMAPGQAASFRVDALNNTRFKGHVENIAPAAGSEFAVLKSDNATGNFVKVAQRIAVRIAIEPEQPQAQRLRPGMSVEASVNTAPLKTQ